jgi:hypothetical protein
MNDTDTSRSSSTDWRGSAGSKPRQPLPTGSKRYLTVLSGQRVELVNSVKAAPARPIGLRE